MKIISTCSNSIGRPLRFMPSRRPRLAMLPSTHGLAQAPSQHGRGRTVHLPRAFFTVTVAQAVLFKSAQRAGRSASRQPGVPSRRAPYVLESTHIDSRDLLLTFRLENFSRQFSSVQSGGFGRPSAGRSPPARAVNTSVFGRRGRGSKTGSKFHGSARRFTPAEDTELVRLKEAVKLPWKDIKDRFFPDRIVGGLQVHYCNKLSPKRQSTVSGRLARPYPFQLWSLTLRVGQRRQSIYRAEVFGNIKT